MKELNVEKNYTHDCRGKWGDDKKCPDNMAICGVKVRMADSSTAMNGAQFRCCELPISSSSTTSDVLHSSTVLPASTESTLLTNSESTVKGKN